MAIESASDIDLGRHGVIEASAGTGKTHTIQDLVARLLQTADVSAPDRLLRIDQLLVLTFTEKATAELKERIRRNIERAARSETMSADVRNHLRLTLDAFDLAQVFTIHGFCQRMLREYSFENREPLSSELVDDGDVLAQMLRRRQRIDWPQRFGGGLEDVLAVSKYPRADHGESVWDNTLLRLAQCYRPRAGDVIEPPPKEDFDYATLLGELHRMLGAIREMVGAVDADDVESNALYATCATLERHATRRQALLRKHIAPLLGLLTKGDGACLRDFGAFFDGVSMNNKTWEELFAQLLANAPATSTHASLPLAAIGERLDLLSSCWRSVPYRLTTNTVVAIKGDAEEYKRQHGLISYDDMLDRLDTALTDNSGGLLVALRRRYAYALVDEFQDTDAVQWRILKRLFAEQRKQGLFVIGDPKQAIYGFRGADVETYLEAKHYLLTKQGARHYLLDTNWRSIPALIGALNRVFCDGEWFPPAAPEGGASDSIALDTLVRPPSPDKRRTRLYRDDSGLGVLVAIALQRPHETPITSSSAQRRMAWAIAAEIGRLLDMDSPSPAPLLTIGAPDGPRPLQAGDICVLVRKRREAYCLERALAARRIPYSFYKKPGLYESEEATHVSYLLSAIAATGDGQALKRALATPFFQVPLEKLRLADGLAMDHRIRTLFAEWSAMSERNDWPRLFQSVFEDTGVACRLELAAAAEGTAAPAAETGAATPDPERRIANYRQILGEMQTAALSRQLDIAGIVDHLNRLRRRRIEMDEDTDLHPLETERPKVQLMTIHASKGLEFPVVFLAGGFTSADRDPYYKFHADTPQGRRVVYDLVQSTGNKQKHIKEQDDEARRLFYVALTRAMHKLYVPLFNWSDYRRGPLCTLVYPALEAALRSARPGDVGGDSGISHIQVPAHLLSAGSSKGCWWDRVESVGRVSAPELDSPPPDSAAAKTESEVIAPDPLLPVVGDFTRRRIRVDSFTGLRDRAAASRHDLRETAIAPSFGQATPAADDENEAFSAVEDGASPSVQKVELPHGSRVGSMLHEILAALDWSAARTPFWRDLLAPDSASERLIERLVSACGLRGGTLAGKNDGAAGGAPISHKEETARLVWTALNVPLAIDGERLRLCELAPTERLAELEFYLSAPTGFSMDAALPDGDTDGSAVIPHDGYFYGIIDLVFSYRKRVYLLDWKSNYLGADYSYPALAAKMAEESYDLQYGIYSLAMADWLQTTGRGYEDFGGVFYLFLRGLKPNGQEAGVYFTRPRSRKAILEICHAALGRGSVELTPPSPSSIGARL